jgi:hypothetical protein
LKTLDELVGGPPAPNGVSAVFLKGAPGDGAEARLHVRTEANLLLGGL